MSWLGASQTGSQARARPSLGETVIGCLRARARREEAPPRSIRTVAAPILIVFAGHHLIVRHTLAEMADFVAGLANRYVFGSDRETIVLTAAPLARHGIAVLTACDPAIMRNCGGRRAE